MGNCTYCGQKAGLFHSFHDECKRKHAAEALRLQMAHDAGVSQMQVAVDDVFAGKSEVAGIEQRLRTIAAASFIDLPAVRQFLVSAWERLVDTSLEDSVLTIEEEQQLMLLASAFSFNQDDLDHNEAFSRMVKAAVIRDVQEGNFQSRQNFNGPLPFAFAKKEVLIWVFARAGYSEEKVTRHFEGGSVGMSVRVMKGVYIRQSAFRGHPVETLGFTPVDLGIMALTTKNIWFSGARHSFRIPYSKVVSWKPYSEGIGLWRDVANAKQQLFTTLDGWFTYNLARNLANKASASGAA